MPRLVMKFDGTSVANLDRIRRVATGTATGSDLNPDFPSAGLTHPRVARHSERENRHPVVG
jgi:hypothetical protein